MSGFRLRLLGPPGFERDGVPVDLGRHKTIALLAYLAVTGHAQRREALAALLWPDYDQARAAAYLRRALWALKQVVGAAGVLTEQASIGLAAPLDLWVDVHQFRQWCAASQRHGHPTTPICAACQTTLTQAVALYRGDFLSGFTLPDCPAFDEWQFFQAESLRQELAATLEQLIDGHRSRGDYAAAIACARRWLALDPLHEPAHQQLMAVYAAAGQRAAALRQYDECVRILDAELGAPPAEATTQLFAAIKANQFADATAQAAASPPRGAPLPPAPVRPHDAAPRQHLPAPTTSFVGRAAEVAAVRALLARPEVRLLTLSGSGGAGKTRLALQVAADVRASFADGVCFVDLAPISDPALVAATIAEALGVRASGVRPVIARLKEYLHDQQTLLILDNFEQVLPAAPVVTALLAGAPGLTILVTSRAVLRLGGEWDYPVPPLALPPTTDDRRPTIDDRRPPTDRARGGLVGGQWSAVGQYDAVQLFVERARAVKAGFVLGPDNAAAVAAICAKLDGLPLAIELAAARLRVLAPQHILSQLNSRLRLLTGGPRDAPARQRTLRDTIDWSYDLLAVDEQTLFRRLAVFAGGCTLAAAEAVCAGVGSWGLGAGVASPTPNSQLPTPILDALESLLDKHLLTQAEDDADEPRFRMLETIREYALERLAASTEAQLAQSRHAAYYLVLLETHGKERDLSWLSRVEAEHDNLRAALAWTIVQSHIDLAGRMAQQMEWFWFARGHISEGRAWLKRVLAQIPSDSSSMPMQAVLDRMAGYFAFFQGDYQEAHELFEASLACLQGLGNLAGIAEIQINLAMVAEAQGAIAQAEWHCAESLALRRQLGAAEPLADSLYHLGRLALLHGDVRAARALLHASLALFEQVERIGMIPIVLGYLGYVNLAQSDAQAAAASFRQAVVMLHQQGNAFIMPYSLIGLAGVNSVQQPERAAVLLGAAQRLVVQTGLRPSPGEQAIWDLIIADVQHQLGEDAYRAAHVVGGTLTQDQLIANALEDSG